MSRNRPVRVERQCTLWVHDETFSKRPVVFNPAVLARHNVRPGALLKVLRVAAGVAVQDFQSDEDRPKSAQSSQSKDFANPENGGDGPQGVPAQADDADAARKHFVFRSEELDQDYLTRHPNLQISVCADIARLYGYTNRMNVMVALADEQIHSASHVEMTFRDMYQSRADMRRLASSELWQKTLYRGQEILFLGSVRLTVRSIFVNGEKVNSALFTEKTRPIFRSESARFVLYIQMSREMWEFEPTCSGDIIAERIINRFLPELFKRWADLKAHHAISIVLFTRMEIDIDANNGHSLPETGKNTSRNISYRDYYRVVCSAMSSLEASTILFQLKREFREFLREASTTQVNYVDADGSTKTRSMLSGRPSSAQDGNFLEAINLVTTQYAEDHVDRDLVRTGLSVIIISPGTGIFEVDESVLQLTTDNLAHNGIGIDLVCLSPRPLHITPLFRYRNRNRTSMETNETSDQWRPWSPIAAIPEEDPMRRHRLDVLSLSPPSDSVPPPSIDSGYLDNDIWTYAQPHWLEIHYFKDRNDPRLLAGAFIPQISMYEVQMSGKQELDMSLISIPLLKDSHSHLSGMKVAITTSPSTSPFDWLDQYDTERFERPKTIVDTRKALSFRKLHHTRGPVTRVPHVASIFQAPDSIETRAESFGRSPRALVDNQAQDLPKQEPPTTPKPKRRPSIESIRSVSTGGSIKGGDSLKRSAPRPFMFGLRGLSFSKAGAVTAQSTEAATPTKDFKSDTDHLKTSSKVSDRVKSSLARYPSAVSETSPRPTAPIAISKSVKSPPMLALNEEPPVESTATATATGKDGSPSMTDDFTPRARGQFGSISATVRRKPTIAKSVTTYSPWLTVVNPCRMNETFDPAKQYRRWHHLYPRFTDTSAMKWKSLCSPASLPLTCSFFPTVEELDEHYEVNTYSVATEDSDQFDMDTGRAKLLNELISFRLSKGFQIVEGSITAGKRHSSTNLNIFDESSMKARGATVIMSKGDTIHVLHCSGSTVQVSRYLRKLSTLQGFSTNDHLLAYKPFLKTTFAESYTQHTLHFSLAAENYNWSLVDNFLSQWEREEYSNALGVWRARFVFIPVPPPRDARRVPSLAEDRDDEIRIEGLQRITQIWDRNRYLILAEKASRPKRIESNPNPLRLDIQTRDASAMAVNGFAGAPFLKDDKPDPGISVFAQADIDLQKLAHAMQNDPSIQLTDRQWFIKTHLRCFIGSEFTTWLLHVVKDLMTREDAVRLAGQLMERGLFKHVRGQHDFRDGYFFYRLSSEYRESRGESRTSWFSRLSSRSVASTPIMPSTTLPEIPEDIPSLDNASISSSREDRSETSTPERAKHRRPVDVTISDMMEYDVDPRHRSKRGEIISLHYSLLYNPESCYQFRIEWLDANPKLVEDAITHWASTAEKYGLRLVQVPLEEAHKISATIPFRAPYPVTMSVPPPDNHIDRLFDQTTGAIVAPSIGNMRHGYQRALLKRFNFVLEQEAASNFPSDISVSYTWGANDYKYNQFIHQSGHSLAQIDDEGRLLFVINRLHDYRAAQLREPAQGKHDKERDNDSGPSRPSSAALRSRTTPFTSPSLSAISNSVMQSPTLPSHHPPHLRDLHYFTTPNPASGTTSPEVLIRSIEAFCADEAALGAFWDEITTAASVGGSIVGSPMLAPRDSTNVRDSMRSVDRMTTSTTRSASRSASVSTSVRGTPLLQPIGEGVAMGDEERGRGAFVL